MINILKQKIILVIDDDALLQQIYLDALTKHGFIVIQATDGKQGISLAQKQNPDLIVLDIMLPGGMNGFDVLEMLKREPKTKQIPVIILTNLDSEEKVAKVIGAEEYIVKSDNTIDKIVELIKKRV